MDLKTRIVITTKDLTKAGNASVKGGLKGIDDQLNQLRRNVIAAFSVTAAVFFAKKLGDIADEYKEVSSRIKLATDSQEQYNNAQTELLAISQRTRSSLAVNAVLFNRINKSTKELGGTQERSLRLTELIGKAAKIGGENATTSQSAIRQLNQGLASGVLRGEEYNSVLEGSSRLAQALADGLGLTIGSLREMAEAGELTTARVLAAIESQAAKLDEEFLDVPLKISEAWQIAENGILSYIGKLDEGAGTSATMAEAIALIGSNVSELVNTLLHAGAIFAAVYGAKTIANIKGVITAQLAATAAAKAETAAVQALSFAKLRQAKIDLAAIRSKITDLKVSQKLATSDALRISLVKQLTVALAKEAAALKVLTAAEKSYITVTTVATRATRLLSKALNGLFYAFIAFEVLQILREWSVGFDLWAIAVDAAVQKVITSIGHVLSGDFLDSNATPLQEKLDAIDEKFGDMFVKASSGIESATDRAGKAFGGLAGSGGSAANKLAEAFKRVKQVIEDQAASQKVTLDRQFADIDLFAAQAATQFESAYTSEIDIAHAISQQLVTVNADKTAAIVDHFANQIAVVEAAYEKEIAATKEKNRDIKGLEKELATAKKDIFGEVEKALAESVKNLLDIERQHVAKSKELATERIDHERSAAKSLHDLSAGSESNAQAQIRRQQERAAINKQLLEAEAALKKGHFGDALELSKKAEDAALELAKAEKRAATEGRSYDLDALEAKKTYEKSIGLVDKALVELEKQEVESAKTAKKASEEQADKLENVKDIIKEIDEKLAKTHELDISVDSTAIDAVIAKINAIPTNKTITITTRNVQANQTGGPIFGFNAGGYLPREGQLDGYGGGDKVRALLEPGEFIIRKEAVAAYGQQFMQRVNAIKEPIKRRLGGIIPRFATGGLISSTGRNTVATVNVVGGRLSLNLDIQPDALSEALFKLEEKIHEQIDNAQQRFNQSALRATEQAGELSSRTLERFATDIERIQKDSVRFSESIEDRIRRIKQDGFTEEEKRIDIIKQIREKQAAAEQAIADGDVERAARLNGELISLAEQISTESRDAAGNIIVDQQTAANQAIGFLRDAQAINTQITAERQRQTEAVKVSELASIELQKNEKLAAINAELAAKLAAIETAKQAEMAATRETSSTGSGGGGRSSSTFSSLGSSSGSSSTGSVSDIQRRIDLLKMTLGNFSSFGISSSQTSTLQQLNALYEQLRQARGYAAGGSVPGQGDGDTVPAMLTPGEFVMNKLSVQKYGAGFMDAVNRGILPVQKFANGGQVNNVRESIAVSLSLGGASAQGQFPADDSTRSLIAELQDAGLVHG